jgi:hypothetical protein
MKFTKYILFTIFLSAQALAQTSKYAEQIAARKLELAELQASKKTLSQSKDNSTHYSKSRYLVAYHALAVLAAAAGYFGVRELTHTKAFQKKVEKFLHSGPKTRIEILDGQIGYDYAERVSDKVVLRHRGIPNIGKTSCFGYMRMTLTPESEIISKFLSVTGAVGVAHLLTSYLTPETLIQIEELDRERYENRAFHPIHLKESFLNDERKDFLSGNLKALEGNLESTGLLKEFVLELAKKQKDWQSKPFEKNIFYPEIEAPTEFENLSVELIHVEALEAMVLYEIWILEELSKQN